MLRYTQRDARILVHIHADGCSQAFTQNYVCCELSEAHTHATFMHALKHKYAHIKRTRAYTQKRIRINIQVNIHTQTNISHCTQTSTHIYAHIHLFLYTGKRAYTHAETHIHPRE